MSLMPSPCCPPSWSVSCSLIVKARRMPAPHPQISCHCPCKPLKKLSENHCERGTNVRTAARLKDRIGLNTCAYPVRYSGTATIEDRIVSVEELCGTGEER